MTLDRVLTPPPHFSVHGSQRVHGDIVQSTGIDVGSFVGVAVGAWVGAWEAAITICLHCEELSPEASVQVYLIPKVPGRIMCFWSIAALSPPWQSCHLPEAAWKH